jgi:preprotein translocase subunit Sec63
MKDPFQKYLTTYEILGIDEDASNDEIKRAFKKAMLGKNKNQATIARKKLLVSTDRIIEDFFLYNDQAFDSISGTEELRNMLTINRGSTASKWRQKQLAIFPKIELISHSLMVLWYWAAVDLVETIREKNNGKI